MAAMRRNIGFVVALVIAGIAGACGPATPPPDSVATAGDKSPPTQTPADGTAAPAATGAEPAATAGKPGEAPAAAKPAGKPSTPLQASKLLEDVKKLGIDIAKTPELAKIPLQQKKKLMPFFQKSLGFDACTGCHVEGDFKKDTRNMKIARNMWKHFVANMRDEKGGLIFCDSCHNGSSKNLNRDDKEALKKFMEDEYEHKLTRADKKENECTTCHSDTLELKIIEKLWNIPKG